MIEERYFYWYKPHLVLWPSDLKASANQKEDLARLT
jgi:hypothetical protein